MIYLQHIIADYEMPMDTSKLKLFIGLANAEHFNRAAEQCHVSPSKLTRVIQQMEKELGVRLFDRDNRSVSLTSKGQEFLEHSRELVRQWETIKDTMNSGSGLLSGSISLYCSVTASYSFLYEIMEDFRDRHPLIQIKLHTGDSADAMGRVIDGHEDIAIAAKPPVLHSSLSFKKFDTSPLVFYCSQDNQEHEQIFKRQNESALSHTPMIVSEKGLARERFDQWANSEGIKPNIYAQVAGNEAIVSMVSLGFGVGLIPQIVYENSPLKNRVKPIPLQPKLVPFEVGVCVKTRGLKSPLVKALWDNIGKR
ncbi:HTH-type transcriptional activator IlvY [Teredinibacter franksiae]|jgi:transcriptional regulator, LysR family|uniref:HTH-type transcriptional activator IlvY n=1 Tax=Teredinibacter franksiae TaxID=2761453 RepID=UPI001FE37BC8|nr:HTH-type transcriptional activator IlvY [Teredinibacter franksiae]